MKIEILAVGSELVSPFFQDTNSLYLTQRLNDLGLDVSRKTVVGDDFKELCEAIRSTAAVADLLLIMGGLGPTADDITRDACAEALGRKLIFRPDLLGRIEERFTRRGKMMPPSNRNQANLLDGAEVLENANGTAPGQWLVHGNARIVLLPGPPRELKPMFDASVWPRLQEWRTGATARRALKITGLTESEVEELIRDLYPKTPALRLTILSAPGQIELHLTAFSDQSADDAAAAVERLNAELRLRLSDNLFSSTGNDLETVVGCLLRERRRTLATAESCTGGLLANRITNVPGSSDYFLEGFITYSNRAKNARLDVPPDLILAHGAVSPEVARAMASGVRTKAGAYYGLAVTGIAGPSGGTLDKPVGLVYTALAWDGGEAVRKNIFLGQREQVKFQTSQKALDMLRRFLIGAAVT
jgi:nicotinamide-nucleotide amidase